MRWVMEAGKARQGRAGRRAVFDATSSVNNGDASLNKQRALEAVRGVWTGGSRAARRIEGSKERERERERERGETKECRVAVW